MELHLERALHFAKYNGITDPEKKIMQQAWPNTNKRGQRQNLTNVINGKTKPTPELIKIWVDVCKCSLNLIYYGKNEEI